VAPETDRRDGIARIADIVLTMSPRRLLACPLISLCALFACQAEPAKVTSIGGGGDEPPAPPALPPPSDSSGAGGGGGNGFTGDGPGGIDPSDLVGVLPTGAPEVPVDAGQPDIETMVNANCANTKITAVDTTVVVPADIIIAVDTSSSMLAEVGFIQDQLNAFSQQISGSGVDARVILIAQAGQPGEAIPNGGRNKFAVCVGTPLGSGTCPEDSNLPGYVHVDQFVDSHDALDQFINTFPLWSEHLRPNSQKALMVITDDEATMSAEDFKTQFLALDPVLLERWNMNGVVSYSMCKDANNDNLADGIGETYLSLIEETSGVSGDLCEQNFQPVFDALATQIVENAGAELLCEWEIPPAVADQTFSTELVEVNRTTGGDAGVVAAGNLARVNSVADCTAGGWYFDDNYNPSRIIACETTCADMQDDANGGIDVVFGCEAVEGCAANEEAALQGEPNSTGAVDVLTGGDSNSNSSAPQIAVACEWPLPELDDRQQELDLENVNVRYTTSKGFGVIMGSVTGADACATAELGWYFDDPEQPTKIVACPETCEVLTSRQITEVNALFGCKTRPAKPRTL
jgi:hypothetical protein